MYIYVLKVRIKILKEKYTSSQTFSSLYDFLNFPKQHQILMLSLTDDRSQEIYIKIRKKEYSLLAILIRMVHQEQEILVQLI